MPHLSPLLLHPTMGSVDSSSTISYLHKKHDWITSHGTEMGSHRHTFFLERELVVLVVLCLTSHHTTMQAHLMQSKPWPQESRRSTRHHTKARCGNQPTRFAIRLLNTFCRSWPAIGTKHGRTALVAITMPKTWAVRTKCRHAKSSSGSLEDIFSSLQANESSVHRVLETGPFKRFVSDLPFKFTNHRVQNFCDVREGFTHT